MNTSMDILGVKYEFGPSVFYLFGPPDSVYRISPISYPQKNVFSVQKAANTIISGMRLMYLPGWNVG